MHITDTQLTLGSRHSLERMSFNTTTLEWICDPGEAKALSRTFEQELNDLMAARLHDVAPIEITPRSDAPERLHDLLETMLDMLFGKSSGTASPVLSVPTGDGDTVPRAQAWPSLAPRAHWQITRSEQSSEAESCQFSASGKVCLADGSERQFDVGFQLERSEEISQTVSRTLIDPLVLDRAAPTTALASTCVEFDLDCDGKLEQMRLPGVGSAFLFLDRNHNGKADNGSELFGPGTGNGFAELARLDSDRNGWIDEVDPAFADLMLWQAGNDDRQVQRLDQAGIGALATASTDTPFELKENGEKVGQMRSSSVWLGERSGAGVVRQIDVSTTPVADNTA